MARAGETLIYTGHTTGAEAGAQRRLNENPLRCKTVFENRAAAGGGNVFLSATQRLSGLDANPTGIKIVPGGNFVDDAPGVSKGEWFVAVDTDNTVYAITEWVED